MEQVNIIKIIPVNDPITIYNKTLGEDIHIYGFMINEHGDVSFIENGLFIEKFYSYKEPVSSFYRYRSCKFTDKEDTPPKQQYFDFYDE